MLKINWFYPFSIQFQVLDGSSVRGFFEPATSSSKWMKEIRTVYSSSEANIKCIFVSGIVSLIEIIAKFRPRLIVCFSSLQIWCEVVHDIADGDELLSVPRVPLQFRDIYNGPQDQFSDRETGKRVKAIRSFLSFLFCAQNRLIIKWVSKCCIRSKQ